MAKVLPSTKAVASNGPMMSSLTNNIYIYIYIYVYIYIQYMRENAFVSSINKIILSELETVN